MAQLIIIAVVILAAIGFIIWLATRERKAGAVTEQAKVATKTVAVQQAQDKAAAEAPQTVEAVADALDKGEF